MTNIWNKNEIITPISEYNLLYQYNKHVNQVQNIKEQPMNVEKPFHKKKLKSSTSKKLLEIKHPENTENKILVQKILTINNQPSSYALNEDLPIKPSNLGQKILEMRKLIEDNEGIEKRIKQTNSVINFDKIKQEYKKNKLYLKNLTAHSRRIYNCFVPRVQVPVEVKKKKRVTEKKIAQQQPEGETDKKLVQQLEEPNVADVQQMKSKSNLDQDKLIYQLNELKLKEDCSEQSEDD
ncbi:unnamed protein product (macronuclear) [Paramecium tetraurelia]|uniref:Uncharacterized protein n=1 Tax=Paramecium tetraurelia TaxID=5888 RepID=A0CJ50_PARTE|nr:uncharacterized protein GSPATT00038599001 [Paramecium tetraurelia]CAK70817.1 unnamed protein product [Paramecium tetraurelia]|eukprot:XP_001438214.1 hypothetical protein (macronuclear) [Paramecium tetraurelia strain d4-2]